MAQSKQSNQYTQSCVADAISMLKKLKPDFFLHFIDINHEEVFGSFLYNVVDKEMRQYYDINNQIPCSKEILEKILHSFTEQQCTIRFYVCQLMRGQHEGGIAYQVEEHILYLDLPPTRYFDGKKMTSTNKFKSEIDEITPDVNDYAFVLRSSKSSNGEIGAGHLMLVKYNKNLPNELMVGRPDTGLKM